MPQGCTKEYLFNKKRQLKRESELERDGRFLPKLRDIRLISALIVEYQDYYQVGQLGC